VPASITLFVSLEMLFIDALGRLGPLPTVWHCAPITMLWMESVIYVATELAGAMKPRSGANEDLPIKPFWAVVAGGSTPVRSGVIIAVGTLRGDTDVDADLSLCFRGAYREAAPSNRTQQ
jgi:hypothetical protein